MQIGPYEVSGELGRGAMGVVLQGYDYAIGRPVAIKVIRSHEFASTEERADASARFRREAAAAGRLSHPGIITIYQYGEDQGFAFLAMEFVQGQSLERLLASGNPPPLSTLLDILRQAADALDYAHSQGVIHRDIKPGNILVRADGKIKITDFGIARIVSQTFTQANMTMGTIAFMSPEQLQGSRVDGRADQYSLAAMIFRLLTARPVFESDSFLGLSYKICHEDPTPPSKFNPRLTAATDKVLLKALAKNPEARYPACVQFVAELERAMLGTGSRAVSERVVTPHGLSTGPYPAPPKRRSREFAIAIGVAAILVAIGLAVVWFVWLRHERPCDKEKYGCYYEDAVAARATLPPEDSLSLFQRAAGAGDPRGMLEMGLANALGRGTSINFDAAARWYRKAADAGNGDAMARLGEMYDGGHGFTRDLNQLVNWYRKSVDAGSGLGMNDLGLTYEMGIGVPVDYGEAFIWYRKSAEAGCATGMANLGSMYAVAHSVPENNAEALRWFHKAADLGDGEGIDWLGMMYRDGLGVTKDYAQALSYFRKAAAIPYAHAMINVAAAYELGTGVAKDEPESFRWYMKAAELGDNRGMFAVGIDYATPSGVSKDDREAVSWFKKAADAGNGQGMDWMGWMNELGRGVDKVDLDEAVRWYRMADAAGYANGTFNLGRMFETGRGVPLDLSQAMLLYEKAAKAGNKPAQEKLDALRPH